METRIQLNNLRLAPRKVRSVVDLIKGKNLSAALIQLEHLIRRPAHPILKLLRSGAANAEHNFHMVRDNLYVKTAYVNEGVKLRRFMPRAQGRATEIQKKMSSVTVILDERVSGMRNQPTAQRAEAAPAVTAPTASGSKEGKPEIKRELGKKSGTLSRLGRRIFQRKTG